MKLGDFRDTFHVLKSEVSRKLQTETSQRPGATESQKTASKFLQLQNTFDWSFLLCFSNMQFIHWRNKNSSRSNFKMNWTKTVATCSTSFENTKKNRQKFSENENTIILFWFFPLVELMKILTFPLQKKKEILKTLWRIDVSFFFLKIYFIVCFESPRHVEMTESTRVATQSTD
jgi:hypothetical protein